jgi:hypothetical protein
MHFRSRRRDATSLASTTRAFPETALWKTKTEVLNVMSGTRRPNSLVDHH